MVSRPGRKSLRSLGARNGPFRGIVCFQCLELHFISRRSRRDFFVLERLIEASRRTLPGARLRALFGVRRTRGPFPNLDALYLRFGFSAINCLLLPRWMLAWRFKLDAQLSEIVLFLEDGQAVCRRLARTAASIPG